MKKRISVVILVLILLCVMLSGAIVPVGAITFEPGKEPTVGRSGNFGYLLFPDGSVYISNYFGDTSGDVVIPATLDGRAVDGFWMKSFYYRDDITSIVISEGISSIGVATFCGCSNLVSITIPASLTSIGMDAFARCTALQTVIYNGTEEQLAQMRVGIGNGALGDANADFLAILNTISSEPIDDEGDEGNMDSDEAGNVSNEQSNDAQEGEKIPVDKETGILSSLSTDIKAVIVLGGLLVLCIAGILFLRAKRVK